MRSASKKAVPSLGDHVSKLNCVGSATQVHEVLGWGWLAGLVGRSMHQPAGWLQSLSNGCSLDSIAPPAFIG